MRLSVASVTTAYNAANRLPRQLDNLLRQARPLDEIVVIDNASSDETARLLGERYPQITVLKMRRNLGAAGAWAAGLAYAALRKRHDWVWTFDDDSVPSPDALLRLLECAEPPGDGKRDRGNRNDVSRIGMISMLPVHEPTGACYWPLLWRQGFVKPPAELRTQPVWFADLTYTSGLMIRRELVEEIGLPRSDFFMDFFDFEYCLRARGHGHRIAIVTGVKLAHEIGAARKVRLPGFSALWPNHAPWREYYMSRNLAYAVWWLHPSRRAKGFVVRHLVKHACGACLFGRHKLPGLKKSLQGFLDGRRARLGIRFQPEVPDA